MPDTFCRFKSSNRYESVRNHSPITRIGAGGSNVCGAAEAAARFHRRSFPSSSAPTNPLPSVLNAVVMMDFEFGTPGNSLMRWSDSTFRLHSEPFRIFTSRLTV